jgi:hypothetical protein
MYCLRTFSSEVPSLFFDRGALFCGRSWWYWASREGKVSVGLDLPSYKTNDDRGWFKLVKSQLLPHLVIKGKKRKTFWYRLISQCPRVDYQKANSRMPALTLQIHFLPLRAQDFGVVLFNFDKYTRTWKESSFFPENKSHI